MQPPSPNENRTVGAAAAIGELRRFVKTVFVIFFAAMLYITWQSYEGRKDIRDNQVEGCERGKLDRAGAARGWSIAAHARRNEYLRDGHEADLKTAEAYEGIAAGFSHRASIVCEDVYPPPSLLPL